MKIKIFSLFVLLFCTVSSIFAQMQDPVHWTYEISPIQQNGEVTVTFSASIDEPWHMYDVNEPADGPVPTSFKYATVQNAEPAGDIVSKSSIITRFEQAFGMNLTFYEGVAVFQQKFKVKDVTADVVVEGNVEYMCCNDQMCLPPTKKKFSVTAKGIEKSASSVANPEKKTKDQSSTRNEIAAEPKLAPFEVIVVPPPATPETEQPNAVDTVKSVAADTVAKPIDGSANGSEVALTAYGKSENENSSLWAIFLSGLIGGFIAVVTPCIWPLIPMNVSFFMKNNGGKSNVEKREITITDAAAEEKKKRKRGLLRALFYCLSIIIIYVSLGLLITSLFSANTLNKLSTDAGFNVVLFLMLIVFACSFFGGFELMLPASWTTSIDGLADQMYKGKKEDDATEKKSIVKRAVLKVLNVFLDFDSDKKSPTKLLILEALGIVLMASTLVLVSFSCTGPIIGTLLVSVSSKGDILAPAIGMFGFALALSIPFSLIAIFPDFKKSLPHTGNWSNMVKVLLGFFELAFSLKFLSVADQTYGWGILSRPTFIAIWIVLFIMVGVYLLGKLKLPHDTDVPCVSVPRLLMAIASFSFAVYLLPGLFGAPLNVISAFAPPMSKTDASFYQGQGAEAKSHDYNEALKIASQENKPLIIDFTGYGCVNCRKMETAVWTNPTVADLLNNKCVLVSLFTDDRTPLATPEKVIESNGEETVLETLGEKWSYLQRNRFNANAQPYYVMINPKNGKVYEHYFQFSENANAFSDFIRDGISNLK